VPAEQGSAAAAAAEGEGRRRGHYFSSAAPLGEPLVWRACALLLCASASAVADDFFSRPSPDGIILGLFWQEVWISFPSSKMGHHFILL
jgi:hypothetical protein